MDLADEAMTTHLKQPVSEGVLIRVRAPKKLVAQRSGQRTDTGRAMYSALMASVKNHSSTRSAPMRACTEAMPSRTTTARSQDEADQHDVEQPAGATVGLEDHRVHLQPQAGRRRTEGPRSISSGPVVVAMCGC